MPNWILEDLLRASGRAIIPYEASHLLLYITRELVGKNWASNTFNTSTAELAEVTGISPELISRYAHAFSYVGFLLYVPAKNGFSNESRFQLFPNGLPDQRQVQDAISGLADAVKEARSQKFTVAEFGGRARAYTAKWALQNTADEARRLEIKRRFQTEKQGLL